MPESSITSPPAEGATPSSKGISHSPSMFGYQERILQRTSSTTVGGRPLSLLASPDRNGTHPVTSVPTQRPASPPSTPIRASVSRMVGNQTTTTRPVGLGVGLLGDDSTSGTITNGTRSHPRTRGSVDWARSQWESKVQEQKVDKSPIIHSSPARSGSIAKRSAMFSPPLETSSTFSTASSSAVKTPVTAPRIPATPEIPSTAPSTESISSRYGTPSKRSTITGIDGFDVSRVVDASKNPSNDALPDARPLRTRPASISSYSSIMTPQGTGSSSTSSSRAAVEDTLAQARANALKRLEARKRAKGEAVPEPDVKANDDMPRPSTPSSLSSLSSPPIGSRPQAGRSSVLDVFAPTANTTPSKMIPNLSAVEIGGTPSADSVSKHTPSSVASAYKSLVTPPSASAPRYVPSGLSVRTPFSGSSGTASNSSTHLTPESSSSGKYGSISRADNRRLGRHLPRIASGGEGWDEEEPVAAKKVVRRVPSNLAKVDSVILPSSLGETSATPPRTRAEPLGPSRTENASPAAQVPSTPSTKRRSYVLHTPKGGLTTPRPEVAGDEMIGLMSDVGSLPSRGVTTDEAEGVTGESDTHNRSDLQEWAIDCVFLDRLYHLPLCLLRHLRVLWLQLPCHPDAWYNQIGWIDKDMLSQLTSTCVM